LSRAYTKVSNARLKVLRDAVQKVMAITEARDRFWQGACVSGIAAQGPLCFMRYERSNEHAPRTPLCPSCAQVMRLVRVTSRFEKLPDLYIFECRACGLTHIDAA
jgi:hypothetical protein